MDHAGDEGPVHRGPPPRRDRAAHLRGVPRRIRGDWAGAAARHSRPGSEPEDFLRLPWDPLPALGFEFTRREEAGAAGYHVSRCPVHEIARSTGLHRWMYHLACASDLASTPAFCPRIRLERSKALVLGDDCCEFRYEMTKG